MKVRILFRDYEISDSAKQQLLYGVAVLVSILSVFSIIFMFSYYSEDPVAGAFPSSSPSSAFTQQMQNPQDPRVAGAQTQNRQMMPQPSSGPEKPTPKPIPSPSSSPTPAPSIPTTATPTPSPSPSLSPSSAPSQPPPSAPSGLTTTSGCDGTNVKVLLTWSSASNASSYKIFRDDKEIKDNVEGTNYSDTSVAVGTLYAYSIKAKGSGGESSHSDSKAITPTSCSSPSPTSSP